MVKCKRLEVWLEGGMELEGERQQSWDSCEFKIFSMNIKTNKDKHRFRSIVDRESSEDDWI